MSENKSENNITQLLLRCVMPPSAGAAIQQAPRHVCMLSAMCGVIHLCGLRHTGRVLVGYWAVHPSTFHTLRYQLFPLLQALPSMQGFP